MQLFEQFRIRWGVMIIGPTQSGKTTIYKTLEKAQNRLC
jgi:ABC-type multidrug transport system fused ATPase/permease subunit